MRVLVTGGTGFVGRHLARHLVQCGDNVALTYLPGEVDTDPLSTGMSVPKTVQAMALDVTDKQSVSQLVAVSQPDSILHLAGLTFVPEAERDRNRVFAVNYGGTLNLLDAVKERSPHTKILVVSSSEVYGEPRPSSLPLTEAAELRPVNAYAASKAAADICCFPYAFRDQIDVVRVRPFPHIGPGQSDRFALSSFSRQLAEIKLGQREAVIEVGNLEAKRDYSDVHDIVKGYREALLNGKRGEVYNFCSGKSHAIGEILERLIRFAGLEGKVEVREDPERVRPVDIADVYGDYSKAQKDFGWRPRTELDLTLRSLIDYWLEELG